jgi:hypothetical protein
MSQRTKRAREDIVISKALIRRSFHRIENAAIWVNAATGFHKEEVAS